MLALAADATPSNQTLVFYNARLALREERPAEALKLWLLRNSVADREGFVGIDDPDFRSVVWAATGKLGLCQDGLSRDDEGGAGLWPIGLHNWTVQARGTLPELATPWDAFDVSRQQRLISLHDVLSAPELRTVAFHKTECVRVNATLAGLGDALRLDLADKMSIGTVLRRLLAISLKTIDRSKLPSTAVIEARMFDLDLVLDQMYARQRQRESNATRVLARKVGVSEVGANEVAAKKLPWGENSHQAQFLRKAITWPVSDWMSLTRERRLFLFEQARPYISDRELVRPLILGIIDALLETGGSDELEIWVGHLEATDVIARRADVFEGARGKRLLDLEPTSGFRERASNT